MMITSKMWPLEHQQGFPLIWPGELVYDIKWPSFKLDLEIIKTNILSKIHDDHFKNVTSRASRWFSFDLVRWPSFWYQVTQFKTRLRNHQDKHFEQYLWWLFKQEAHGPRVAHLSDKLATADVQMLCNIFPILSSQLMKRSSFKQFFILKKKIYGMPVNWAWSSEQTPNGSQLGFMIYKSPQCFLPSF